MVEVLSGIHVVGAEVKEHLHFFRHYDNERGRRPVKARMRLQEERRSDFKHRLRNKKVSGWITKGRMREGQ